MKMKKILENSKVFLRTGIYVRVKYKRYRLSPYFKRKGVSKMNCFDKTRNEFTAYIKAVIQNAATDYKRKLLKSIEHEISVSDFSSLPKELLSYDDGSFLLEKDITYSNIEKLFANEKYYRAMKMLSDKEKLILYLCIIEEKKTDEVAEIMNITKNNVWKIKSRAIKNFLNNL